MITTRQMKMLLAMPKAENHIHIEGSIPLHLTVRLAEQNHVPLPYDTPEALRQWVRDTKGRLGLNGFMACNRQINSVCQTAGDYEAVVLEMAKQAKAQNILYQELHLDYQLNGSRGIPLEVVMEGYASARKKAQREIGVELVYIAGLDRTRSPEECLAFVRQLEPYLDEVAGLGMDCEEKGHPGRDHAESYRLAADMGLYLTTHAGEDAGEPCACQNIWDALDVLGVRRVDHACQSVRDPALLGRLAEERILCTVCPTANIGSRNAESYATHPAMRMVRNGVPCSINSDNPPYSDDLVQNYAKALDLMRFTEEELLAMARNAFLYSIKGQRHLETFDRWQKEWRNQADGML